MDAAVGFQFWYFGDGETSRGRPKARDVEVLVVVDGGQRWKRRFQWRRATGWMRGWVPSVSVAGTPSASVASTPSVTPRGGSPRPESLRGALDEARALLGTERSGSAGSRGYGGVS